MSIIPEPGKRVAAVVIVGVVGAVGVAAYKSVKLPPPSAFGNLTTALTAGSSTSVSSVSGVLHFDPAGPDNRHR